MNGPIMEECKLELPQNFQSILYTLDKSEMKTLKSRATSLSSILCISFY